MPRILMAMEHWGRGGTEAYVGQLVAWLNERDIGPVSLCLFHGDKASAEEVGAALPGLAEPVHVLGGRGRTAAPVRFYRLLRRLRPDVCHLHLYSSLFPAVLAARSAFVPLVVTTLHMPLWQWSLRHRIGWRLAVAASHRLTGGSSATLGSVGHWPESDSARRVPPPLSPVWRKLPGREPDNGGDAPLIVAGAGRLSREKAWHVLLHALAIAGEDCRGSFRLRLFGDGPERRRLEVLADRLGVGGMVRFEGHLPQERLARELAGCDVFVLPSDFEGFGMSAVEAMSLGIPTITSDYGASADYIEHGVTGHRFPRGDAPALADLLRWHLTHRGEARVLAERGRTFVRERFEPDTVFAPLPTLYSRQ